MIRFEDCRLIGRVGKPHGHAGAVKLELLPDLETDLNIDEPVFLLIEGKPVPFFMDECNEAANPPIVHFEDITGMESARALQSLQVYAPKSAVEADQEWTAALLVGFQAFDGERPLGPVLEIIDAGMQELLRFEINGREVLVPLQNELIEDFDEARRELHLRLPEGLVEIGD
ncbi:MAG: ribosome maturation factor RimM [Bacteroidota bacterium]|nr:ribosome maturation factor RimM [Bacteroidota bacterium]MDX5430701.1 ribosome maturation factor RimM [Bacteroidota bacterium]MDX5469448.1 ribosome maturation factor RimM [Bacteroidota bacterium]